MNEPKRGSHPKPGAKPENLNLNGLRYARGRDGQPRFVEIGEGEHASTQLPLFRSMVALGEFYFGVYGPGVIFEDVIHDRDEFMLSIPGHVEIVVEPRRNADGYWEYKKVLRD